GAASRGGQQHAAIGGVISASAAIGQRTAAGRELCVSCGAFGLRSALRASANGESRSQCERALGGRGRAASLRREPDDSRRRDPGAAQANHAAGAGGVNRFIGGFERKRGGAGVAAVGRNGYGSRCSPEGPVGVGETAMTSRTCFSLSLLI